MPFIKSSEVFIFVFKEKQVYLLRYVSSCCIKLGRNASRKCTPVIRKHTRNIADESIVTCSYLKQLITNNSYGIS